MQRHLQTVGSSLDSYLVPQGEPLFTLVPTGKQEVPLYTLKELIDAVRANGRKEIEIQRYKGLGEMNPDQLWETTMDPAKRTLVKVQMADLVAAEYMFSMLMGEAVPPRRAFIEQHALAVKNLDI
ncbi:MAG: DNA gyrase subunit B, partial [Verrucomicrobia bacterium]|nr:DNA gyrase subunit B [Verrucomicrobiota bacterium]